MADIKIGNVTFNSDAIKDISLTEAYEKFSYLRKDIVKSAHEKVNGTRTKRRKKS